MARCQSYRGTLLTITSPDWRKRFAKQSIPRLTSQTAVNFLVFFGPRLHKTRAWLIDLSGDDTPIPNIADNTIFKFETQERHTVLRKQRCTRGRTIFLRLSKKQIIKDVFRTDSYTLFANGERLTRAVALFFFPEDREK